MKSPELPEKQAWDVVRRPLDLPAGEIDASPRFTLREQRDPELPGGLWRRIFHEGVLVGVALMMVLILFVVAIGVVMFDADSRATVLIPLISGVFAFATTAVTLYFRNRKK
jgi:hypothetical protein